MAGTGDDQGILPRCLDMVFNSIENVQARKYVSTGIHHFRHGQARKCVKKWSSQSVNRL